MKTFARAALLAAVLALPMGGCATGLGAQALKNLEGCERRYEGVVSAGLGAGFSGTVTIYCPPAVSDVEPVETGD